MKIIQKVLRNLSAEVYNQKHLQIINQFLPIQMTEKEVEVLAAFMALDGDIAKKDRFGTTPRKIVMEKLGISPGGLGNYLKSLRDKNYIFKNEYNVLQIRDFLLPEESAQGYQFKIQKQD